MNRVFIFCLLLFFFLFPHFTYAEEKDPIPPSPTQLQTGWWSFFDVKPEELNARIQKLQEALKPEIEKSPSESKQEIGKLVEQLNLGIKNFITLATKKPEKPLPPKTIADTYTLTQVIQLHKNLRQSTLLLKAEKDEYADRQNKIRVGQNRLFRLQEEYKNTSERSIDRLKQGLRLMAFRFNLESEKLQAKQFEKAITRQEREIKELSEELNSAKARIVVTQEEVNQAKAAKAAAKKAWDQAADILASKEEAATQAFTFQAPSNEERIENALINEELIEAHIADAAGENRYIFAAAKLDLIRFYSSDPDLDLSEVAGRTQKNTERVQTLLEMSRGWSLQLNRALKRIEANGGSDELAEMRDQVFEKIQETSLHLNKLEQDIEDSQFLLEMLTNQISVRRGGLDKWLVHLGSWIKSSYSAASNSLTTVIFNIGDTPVTLMSFFRFFVILAVTFWVSHVVRIAIKKVATRKRGIRRALRFRLERLFHYLILILGILIALTSIGFDFSNFLLIAGALGVGLGFGLQSIFNNFISGIIILFESQLQVGDYIEMENGIRGEVIEINFRSTYIKTNDGVAIIVPNSEFINFRVINWTLKEGFRRIRIPFSVAYDSDKDLVAKVVQEAAEKVPLTLKSDKVPDPKVGLVNLGQDGIEFELVVWVDEKATKRSFSTRSVYLWAIHDVLSKNNIEIPYPQRVVHFAENEEPPHSDLSK